VHYFFSTIISGIEDVAYKAGYNIILCQSDESYQKEVTDSKALLRSRVDGFLVSCSRETENFDHLVEIFDRDIPMVFFDRIFEGLSTNRVIVDDYEGARLAVQHLVDIGCKRIAHLAGPEGLEISKNRLQGYKDVLNQNGIPFDPELVQSDPESRELEGGFAITSSMLELSDPPDAIFAHQDIAAIGAIKAIKEKFLKIPEDVAVVGFSNWQMSLYTDPPLSTVSQPGFEMGQEAARLCIKQMKHNDPDGNHPYIPETKVFKTELIIRESSKRKITV
jgi:LacI family transcriptional regulator